MWVGTWITGSECMDFTDDYIVLFGGEGERRIDREVVICDFAGKMP